MIKKCKTCMNCYPSISCVNCGTGLVNYSPYKPPTNADKIRALSDEELAAMLYSFEDLKMPDYCQRKKECDDMLDADIDIPAENCRRCLVDWLRQPAKEADHA